ncbi:non-contractile tail fiber protein [Shigella phage CT02]|uniref:Non-contractile tail fiber protein n=1 Tax=Shigella phage CT02 TaxID=3003584 RepID=A0A9E9J1K3_9CAUD|nr:non-contractile tail fiber protein [Shigella phage CT02]
MATTIKTVMTYPLDGSTTDFNIPFEYLARKFVRVTLIGVDRKELTLNQDYRFATKTTISTTRALGPADGYNMIEIRRFTSATDRLVDFTDGSILRAYDLNISQVQTLHVAEEARDLTADTIGVNNDGNLDARGRRIINVADGVDLGDVITLGQVTRWNESALTSKNAAKVSETNARASENNAKTSETNAKNSENLAHDWAQKAEDAPVAGSEYSAYHYSRKASTSSTAAASSAAASLASQNAAKVSEDKAKVSEQNAKASEVSAKADAERAEREADKLGNMNNLAANIESASVDPNVVIFKGRVVSRGDIMAATNLRGEPAGGTWWGTQSLVSVVEVNGRKRMQTQLYAEGTAGVDDRKTTIASYEYDSNERITRSSYVHLMHNTSRWWSRQHGALGYQTGWDDPTNSRQAPYWVDDVVNNNDGWVPALSVHSSSTGGYPIRATQGIISRGPNTWPDFGVRLCGDRGKAATFFLTMWGGIQCWKTGYDGQNQNFEFTRNPVSDIRLKNITGKVDGAKCLNSIESMNFVEFTFKRDANKKVRRGVIAQEVQKIDPQYTSLSVMEATNETPRMETLQLDLTPMTLDALAAIKELSSQVKELKAELKQLKEAK